MKVYRYILLLIILILSGCSTVDEKILSVQTQPTFNNSNTFYMVVNQDESLDGYMKATPVSVYQNLVDQKWQSFMITPGKGTSVKVKTNEGSKYIGVYFLSNQLDANSWSFLLPANKSSVNFSQQLNKIEVQS